MATIRASWRLQLRRQVKDAALRRKLVPDYPIGCKRVLFSNAGTPPSNATMSRSHPSITGDRARWRAHRPRGGCTRRTC